MIRPKPRTEQIGETHWYHVGDAPGQDAITVHERLFVEIRQ